ncbi:MAG: helicase-exonuclease AddAB subunit AddB [Clostridiales bacterium]|nr:helicase-exonuclease AddAB subunit AddB [Clostridiales bacterium]
MSLRFYFGPSGAGKSHALYQEIIERSIKEPERNFLLIVPDQFTMQTQKDIVEMHPRNGIMNIDVLSFGRLSHRIFEETGGYTTPVLDDTGKSLVLRKVAQNLEEKLPVIGKNLKKLGYIHEVKSAISEFMQYSITPDGLSELKAFAKSRGALFYKLRDLELLYRSFMEYIKNRYVTTEETLGLLNRKLSESQLIRDSVIIFDGFTGFTPVQNQVIEELLRLCKEVVVTVILGEGEDPFVQDGEQKLFYLSKKTVASLEKLAENVSAGRGRDVFLKGGEVSRFAGNPELSHLEKRIFRYPVVPYGRECGNLCIAEAANPKAEVRYTALAIRRLVREENYCYRDIAVIAGDLGSYDADIEEEFAKFDIPVFIDKTHGILLNPMIEYIRSALLVVQKNFTYESMFHFLRSGFSGLTSEETDILENYVLATGIRGKKAWTNLFTRRSRQFGQAEDLEYVNVLREKIVQELAPLMEKQQTAGGHVRALYEFLVQNEAQKKCMQSAHSFAVLKDAEREREYAQIYRLVMELLDQIEELLADEKMGREEFADILDAGFSEIEVGIIPQNVDKVVAGDMERTRLRQVKALFLLGVNDGNIPAGSTGGGIISDIDREFLSQSEYELSPTPRQKMYIQRLYLYMNMTKTSGRLTLSYTRSTSDGKARKPSYLIGVMHKLFPKIRVESVVTDVSMENLETPQDGLMFLADSLRQFAADRIEPEQKEKFFALYRAYEREYGLEETEKKDERRDEKKEAFSRLLLLVTDRAFSAYEGGKLSEEIATLLYGRVLTGSVSRLEQFAACAYAHFLKYGMTLKEREEYSFEDVDMGNIFHGVLEKFADELAKRNLSWFDFSKEEAEEMVSDALSAYAAQYGETILFSSARNEYMIARMRRILNRTVESLQYQLKKGAFSPREFEVSFSTVEDLEAVQIALGEKEKMRLRGRIDRIDTYETEDKVYVKVIDYKSGSKNFDIVSLYYGLQLQLVVYLNAAEGVMKRKHPGKEIIPAAVLYYHVSDPMIRGEGETPSVEEIQARLRKELSMTGVVNSDGDTLDLLDKEFSGKSDVIPAERKKDGSLSARSSVAGTEQFHRLSDFVSQKIGELGRSIIGGDVRVNPYEKGQTSACTYCAYRTVCGFDSRIEGYAMRQLNVSQEEAMTEIMGKGEGNDGGDEVHTGTAEGH